MRLWRRFPVPLLLAAAAAAAADEPGATPASGAAPSVSLRLTPGDPAELPRPLPIDPDVLAPPAARPRKPGTTGTEFVIAPIPIVNPTFGTGLALAAGLVFPIDPDDADSPPSIAGVGGFYTDSHSYAIAAAFRTYLDHDRWRLLAAAATSDLHYDFFGVGSGAGNAGVSVPLSQRVDGYAVEVLRRVRPSFFAGLRYVWARSVIRVESANPEIPVPEEGRSETSAALGLHLQGDSRDSTFYPARGVLADLKADFNDPAVGATRTYQSYTVAGNVYARLGERGVLAMRLSGCSAQGDVPLYALCLFGMRNDLRGYDIGRYRDRLMYATQAEYRVSPPDRRGVLGRIGFVVFAGVGEVAPTVSAFGSDQLLPSLGGGLRILVARENRINFRIDYAWGKSGRGLYLGLGEAF